MLVFSIVRELPAMVTAPLSIFTTSLDAWPACNFITSSLRSIFVVVLLSEYLLIASTLISLAASNRPETVNTPSARVIKSVSSVCPIVAPFIETLSTVKAVKVPSEVTLV